MELVISEKIANKLKNKHGVSRREVLECISNITGKLIEDTAEEHQTVPSSFWFVAETNQGRKLKVVLVPDPETGNIYLKTAFDANAKYIQFYDDLNS